MERDEPDESEFLQRLSAVNERYEESGDEVLALFEADDIDGASESTPDEEHEISHDLEDSLNELIPIGRGATWRPRRMTSDPTVRSSPRS